jgi:chromatin remodeling complex protein RSC6
MLINEYLANRKLATEFGEVQFNDKGESKDLNAEQEKKFENIAGFTVKKEAAKKEAAKKEPAKKEPAKKEPAKKEPAKKEPAKKEPAKEDEKADDSKK